jgi:hypothetical protein
MERSAHEIDREQFCHLLEVFRPPLFESKYFVYQLPNGQGCILWRQDRRYFSAQGDLAQD